MLNTQLALRTAAHMRMKSATRVLALAGAELVVVLVAALLWAPRAEAATPTDFAIRVTAISFRVGTNGTYTVTVSNLGPATTDDTIHVTDVLPNGLSFVSGTGANWSCSASGQSVDCSTAAPLASGTSTSFRLVVNVCTAAFPSVTNTLTLVYPADTKPANNTVTRATVVKAGQCKASLATATPTKAIPTRTPTPTATPVAAGTDLSLKKTVSSRFTVGNNGFYSLTVSNLGTASTNATITVTDSLPASLSFVSATGTGWTCSATGQVVTCTDPSSLAPAASTSITLTVKVGSAAFPTVTNSATVSYAGDTNLRNNTAQRPTTVRQLLGISRH